MTTPQSLTHAAPVVRAMAQHLHDLGYVQYNPSGGYTENANRPAVVFGILPVAPITAVSIMCYNEVRDEDDDNPEMFIQLRFRALGALSIETLADSVFASLHWSENHPREFWPGGVVVVLSRRISRAPIELTASNQYERADSYRLIINPGEVS